ncbi:hypothetical protein HY484_02610 [Candidatus Woesearchaeota archaeon]|nr:hypothetical protein [Candidatus Woesearchaeota archaeon]
MTANFDVLFCDWSGCISNDLLTVYNAHARTIKQFGKKIVPLDEWRRRFTSLKALYSSFGVELPITAPYRDYPEFYEDVVNDCIKPNVYSEAPAVLERISRKVPIVIVSAQMQYALDREAEEYGVRKSKKKIDHDQSETGRILALRARVDFLLVPKTLKKLNFLVRRKSLDFRAFFTDKNMIGLPTTSHRLVENF